MLLVAVFCAPGPFSRSLHTSRYRLILRFSTLVRISIFTTWSIFVESFLRGKFEWLPRYSSCSPRCIDLRFRKLLCCYYLKNSFFRVIIFRTFLDVDSLTGLYLNVKNIIHVFFLNLKFQKKKNHSTKKYCNFFSKSHIV